MSGTMRAVVVADYGGELELMERPVPRPGAGEVLVRVQASGLSNADLALLTGRQPLGELPRIIGHELAGEVVELGEGVAHWKCDDRVTAAIDVTCGHCRHCRNGQTQRCLAMRRIGVERDGAHAEYVAVPAANLVALPEEIPYAAAAILPGGVAGMYHALIHRGGVGFGHRVLVLGIGGSGVHAVQIARSAGAEILATSRHPDRLQIAEKYGAVGLDPTGQSLEAAAAAFTQGEGFDVVVDNIGTADSVRRGLAVLRPGGRHLIVGYRDDVLEFPSLRLFRHEMEILGCRGSTRQDLIDVVRLVLSGDITPVVGAYHPLEEIGQAVARLQSGELVGRIVLTRAHEAAS